jgi:hypothetical protein
MSVEDLDGTDVPSAGEVAKSLAVIEAEFARLARADAMALTSGERFEVLRALETVDAVRAAVRGRMAAAFDAADGPEELGFRTLTDVVRAELKVTKGKARSYGSWAKRCRAHQQFTTAMAAGLVSESWAELITGWTGMLKDPDLIAAADDILLKGVLSGLDEADLRGLFEEIRALTAPADEDGPEPPHRSLDLSTTLDGSGVLRGNLTPEAAALLQAGLDAYAKHKAGTDDLRTYAERCHDAFVQLLKLALRSGEVPQSNGQDTTAIVHLPLHELRQMDDASALEQGWGRRMHAAWLAELTAGHGKGSETWLYGDDARAIACDAMLAPMVTGHLQPGVFLQIIEVGHELHQLITRHGERDGDGDGDETLTLPGAEAAAAGDARVLDLFLRLTGLVADAVSGPGGLASVLRTGLFAGTPLGKPSLPLDCGDTSKVKPHIRRALNLRHPTCARPGCTQPASMCECHHIIPRARHGPTSLKNCSNLCWYHHHIAVHKLGWTITVNMAGITTVTRPDGTILARRLRLARNGPA